jgi:hypothetical protein
MSQCNLYGSSIHSGYKKLARAWLLDLVLPTIPLKSFQIISPCGLRLADYPKCEESRIRYPLWEQSVMQTRWHRAPQSTAIVLWPSLVCGGRGTSINRFRVHSTSHGEFRARRGREEADEWRSVNHRRCSGQNESIGVNGVDAVVAGSPQRMLTGAMLVNRIEHGRVQRPTGVPPTIDSGSSSEPTRTPGDPLGRPQRGKMANKTSKDQSTTSQRPRRID